MKRLGFKPYLPTALQSCIITAFHFPANPQFEFMNFYTRLSEKGFIIYPGKISRADTFRIANIGHLFEADIRRLLLAVDETIHEMGLELISSCGPAAPLSDSEKVPAPI